MATLKKPIHLAEYLFTRVRQIGIRSVHGVPGDFNLTLLDYVPKADLKWVGNCNELNAGYAADGYARVLGISAVVTTFGVGELSAINAIAGAYSEHVPVVHIVGTPTTVAQKNGILLHHTLGNGDFNVFTNIARNVAVETVQLNDLYNAGPLIDHALRECYIKSRPVYIAVPVDMVSKEIEGDRLKTPIDLSLPPNDPKKEQYVVDVIVKQLQAAQSPVILVDGCAIRHKVIDEVHALMEKTGLPTFVTPMGKSAVNENLPNFGGVYAGNGSLPAVQKCVDSSDLVLSIGAIKSDINTAGFSYHISQLSTIDFHSTSIEIGYSHYSGVAMKGVLKKVVERLNVSALKKVAVPKPFLDPVGDGGSQVITHDWLWTRVGDWLQENDVVVTETGTSNFGILDSKFPKGVTALSQVLWGSIGYAVPATQGAALAARDAGQDRRTILWVGDGSFQLTAQEISSIIRHNLKVTVFIICNEGYTIERLIHGFDAEYNDVQPWRFNHLPAAFGASEAQAKTFTAKTKNDISKLLADKAFATFKGLQFIEVYMSKEDGPRTLRTPNASVALGHGDE